MLRFAVTEVQASRMGFCHRDHGRTRNLKALALQTKPQQFTVHDRPPRPKTSTASSQKEAHPNAETIKWLIFEHMKSA